MRSTLRAGEEVMTAYYKDVDRYPLLGPSEERQLVLRSARGDRRATDKLVQSNLRFVIHVARGFQSHGLPLADLINEGNLGLITAARKFDPAKEVRFITYAVWWIRQNIKKALEIQSRSVRVPANVLNDLAQLRKEQSDLRQHLGREPADHELATASSFPEEKVRHALAATNQPVSLDSRRFDEGEVPLVESIPDEDAPEADADALQHALRNDMRAAFDDLAPRSRHILAQHFGMDGDAPRSYQQIGVELGVSRERVRQLKEEALQRIRQSRAARRLSTYL